MNNNLDELSGATNYQSSQLPKYDEISLDGNFGNYNVKMKTQPRAKVVEDGVEKEKYPTQELGKSIELVWLKVRRQLVESDDKGVVRQTNEHDAKHETVTIKHYTGQAEEKVLSSTIQGQTGIYPKMKVRQIIYALNLKNQNIYRIISKGMSNSMQEKPEDAVLFFDYIYSFKDEDRFYKTTTVMESREIKTKIGMKYYTTFKKGRSLTDEEQKLVAEKMQEVHTAVNKVSKVVVDEPESIDYETGEVNVEDIPF